MSYAVGDLNVDSVTGIDVSLPVAGPGARAYAFVIDWHIRLVLALAWFCGGSLLYYAHLSFAPPADNNARWFGGVLAPALAIYLLYHYVLELLLRGRTPGKRLAGLRVVARDGGVPSAGALLLRNVFRVFDSLPLFYLVGLVTVVVTRENVRIGDMAAGTLLVFDRSVDTLPAAPLLPAAARIDAQGAELIAELLQRWPSLMPQPRRALARQLLKRYGIAEPAIDAANDAALEALLRQLAAGGSALDA
jgi:uncharacterized RDD family membrane protein YckC